MNIPENKIERFKQYLESVGVDWADPLPGDKVIRTRCRRPMIPALQSVPKGVLQQQSVKEDNEDTREFFDNRERVEETTEWPYSVHGMIALDFNKVFCWGTGTLIGPNIVLTAGHNLYNHANKAYANLERMQFLPAVNGQQLPFSYVEVEQYFVSPTYIEKEREDYGILILKEPIGEETGYFGLCCLESEELEGQSINVTGYPHDKVASKPDTYEMWTGRGKVEHFDLEKGEIYYQVYTDTGQAGSGVWFQEGDDYYVCGIHSGRDHLTGCATVLTQYICKQIYQWMHETSDNSDLPQSNQIKELRFEDCQIDAACLSLLRYYKLDTLTTLNLSSKNMGSKEAKALGQNTSWINLSQLDLNNNIISDEGAKALAKNNSWISLLQLNLEDNMIGSKGAQSLGQNTSWIELSELNLEGNKIGDEGVQALAQNTSWIKLSKLNLKRNKIGDKGAQALAKNISWTDLSELNLEDNLIGAIGAKAFAQNTIWLKLSQLNLKSNKIGDKGVEVLRQNTSWINLFQLNVDENKIGDEGAKALGLNTSWIKLSQLNLKGNNIGDEGAQALAQNTSWTQLSQLNLENNMIGDEGVKALAQNTSWIKLSKLNLKRNKIGDKGAQALAKNISWTDLSELNLEDNVIGDEGAKALAQNTMRINLSQLKLSQNMIGEDGAKALGQNIFLSNFSQLNLSKGDTDDLKKQKPGPNSLWTKLNLGGNNINDEEADLFEIDSPISSPLHIPKFESGET